MAGGMQDGDAAKKVQALLYERKAAVEKAANLTKKSEAHIIGVTTNLQAAGVEIKMARKTLENAGLFEDDVEVLRVERLLRQKEEEAQKRKTEAEAERQLHRKRGDEAMQLVEEHLSSGRDAEARASRGSALVEYELAGCVDEMQGALDKLLERVVEGEKQARERLEREALLAKEREEKRKERQEEERKVQEDNEKGEWEERERLAAVRAEEAAEETLVEEEDEAKKRRDQEEKEEKKREEERSRKREMQRQNKTEEVVVDETENKRLQKERVERERYARQADEKERIEREKREKVEKQKEKEEGEKSQRGKAVEDELVADRVTKERADTMKAGGRTSEKGTKIENSNDGIAVKDTNETCAKDGACTHTDAPQKGSIGLGVKSMSSQGEQTGLQVSKLVEGGAAYRSGEIEIGDSLVEVDGFDVRRLSLKQLASQHLAGPAGGELTLQLVSKRKGQTYAVKIKRDAVP